MSADGRRWFLLNVSPDIIRQIESTPALQAAVSSRGEPQRSTSDDPFGAQPIIGAVLTNGDLDHSVGLVALGQRSPLSLYATRETYAGLVVQDAVFRTLGRQRRQLSYRALELDVFIPLRDVLGAAAGLSVCAFPVAGKVPQHLESLVEPTAETNVGLLVRDDQTGARILYVPGAGSAQGIAERARDASCLFFDGTFWSEAEPPGLGQSAAHARERAHLPVSGPRGSLEQLDMLPIAARYYTHVNDTNPMLRAGSAERRAVEARGWSVAEDGLELSV